ncbi:hypothetical protein [Streptomyces sp. SID12501]|uniref:Uncharacterized protein n=1 Tax=Streptomyces sp. SID12501 TaxID=2706042 RepID=A0A6B3C1X0_9ACTN|nr:hypothetical protein [Streptomyces sp. SID12501]NEC90452.1 hypothetical protein [Streptomyces sp. SID12501]
MTNNLTPIAALVPAQPGWTVTVTDLATGDPATCPVIAWAAIGAEVHPVFVANGSIWTGPEYPKGPTPVIKEPAL